MAVKDSGTAFLSRPDAIDPAPPLGFALHGTNPCFLGTKNEGSKVGEE